MTEESVPTDPMQGLSIDRLRAFLAVAEAGGIARAAPNEPSRQSQLSRQLRELQEALGVPLFDRGQRGVALTEAGRRLLAVARDFRGGLLDVRGTQAGRSTMVSLGAGDSVLRWLVLPVVSEVLSEAPGAGLSLCAVSDGLDAVLSGQCGIAVVRHGAFPDGLRTMRLGAMPFDVFVPRRWSKRAGEDPSSLADMAFVDVSADPEPHRWLVEALGRPLEVGLHCETFPQAARAVATGRFAAVLPAVAGVEIPPSVAVGVDVPALRAKAPRLVLIARKRSLEASPAVEGLYRSLAKHLRAGPTD